MAVSLKHAFQSAKGDGTDPTKVQPSNWNDEHDIIMASGKMLGRATVGVGPVEEFDWTAFGRGVMNAADAAALKVIIGKILYADIQNVSSTSRVLGRKTAGAGVTEELTLSELLDFIGSAAQGDVLFRGSAGWQRLATGTAGYFLKTNGAAADPSYARVQPLFHVRYVLATANNGQAYVGGVWSQCLLNTTLTNEISGASLASNQISLDAGTYEIDALIPWTPRNNQPSQGSMGRLRNITDSSDVMYGLGYRTAAGVYGTMWAPLRGRFTIAATKVFQLQFFVDGSPDSFAFSTNTGAPEQYTDVQIRKIG